jgi:hypothetical protein
MILPLYANRPELLQGLGSEAVVAVPCRGMKNEGTESLVKRYPPIIHYDLPAYFNTVCL